jgi:hypothetical protein
VSDGVEGRVLEGWLGNIVGMHLKVEVDLEDIRVDSHMGLLMQDIVEVVQEVVVEQVYSQAEVIAILRIPGNKLSLKRGATQWKSLYGRQSKRCGEWKDAVWRLRKSLLRRLWLDVEI